MSDQKQQMLQTLATDWGYEDPLEMIEDYVTDGLMPGICTEGCGYSTEYEPDQDAGYCECCGTGTVVSAAILAGVI